MTVYTFSGQGGTNGTALLADGSNSGFDSVLLQSASDTCKFSNIPPSSGGTTLWYQYNVISGEYARTRVILGTPVNTIRTAFQLYITDSPAITTQFLVFRSSASSNIGALTIAVVSSVIKIAATTSAGTTIWRQATATPLSINTDYRVEVIYHWDPTTSANGYIRVVIYQGNTNTVVEDSRTTNGGADWTAALGTTACGQIDYGRVLGTTWVTSSYMTNIRYDDSGTSTALFGPYTSAGPPIAQSAVSSQHGLVANFTNAGTSAQGSNTITSHDWDYGDSSTHDTTPTTTHTYAADGSYLVAYKVTDSAGQSTFATTFTVNVSAKASTQRLAYVTTSTGFTGEPAGTSITTAVTDTVDTTFALSNPSPSGMVFAAALKSLPVPSTGISVVWPIEYMNGSSASATAHLYDNGALISTVSAIVIPVGAGASGTPTNPATGTITHSVAFTFPASDVANIPTTDFDSDNLTMDIVVTTVQ